MIRRWVALAALLVTASVFGQDVAAERKLLDGEWTPTAAELSGQPFPEEVLKSMKLIIMAEKYTVKVGDATDRGTVKIDPAKKPKTMDIVGTDGPNKGKTFLAIYEVKDDTLKVCYDLTGKSRPSEFKTKKDALIFLATYQRAKGN